jgi:formate dehydrogenase subunit gamma
MERDATELTTIDEVLSRHPARQDALLPVLQAVRERLGYIPRAALQVIADALNLSRAEVFGVVSFYHDLRLSPGGTHRLQICAAEACQAVGCRALEAHAQRVLGVAFGETTADGTITLERAYCFGNCAAGPTVRLDDTIHGRVNAERFDTLLLRVRAAP